MRLVSVSELGSIEGLVLDASGEDDCGQSVCQLFPEKHSGFVTSCFVPAARRFREARNVSPLRIGKAGMEADQAVVLLNFLCPCGSELFEQQ